MSVKVHVNQHKIRGNLKHGRNDPPIAIRGPGRGVRYAYEVELVGAARVIYSPNKPLSCGARLWIEADDALIMGGVNE